MIAAIAAAFTIIFLACKIQGAIDWSWWVVFSPMLILAGLALVAWVQMVMHQRAHLKHAKAAMEQLGQDRDPFARLAAYFENLGKDGGPPVA